MIKILIILVCTTILSACGAMAPLGCSENWKITGYYTPMETDFTGQQKVIQLSNASKKFFKTDFLSEVKVEGWGKTREGWYLGYYSGSWHHSEFPKDAYGKALHIGKVAADINFLTPGDTIYIENMSKALGQGQFKVADVGTAIRGRHIDIYTGEGEKAKKKTWAITGSHRVCSI